ncbi:MAG: hypothetical protein H6523_12585 [Mycolicibacterium sp.]|uniref:Uncharacterized protein n=2 Tax=Mycolicibacterium insubricum TaxID=444597 RepID=A0A1X0DCV2_9MYCO|nr:hypothetical protein [Mycolicibacterium sp.]ORA70213.1 hypothetical protein BST26_11685 [Mycolicibacterium insubricum]
MGVSAPENRADQLEQLRKRMAAISGRVGSSHRGPGTATARALPDVAPESLLPVPESLLGVLPGGLPRGSVAVTSGARSLPLGIAAAVTAAGGHAAIVGLPGAGLLAAAEMGADLSRIAMIPDPGPDPVEVAAVLTDGMDLVLLGMTGTAVSPGRARVIGGRLRHRGAVLVVVGGDWPGPALRLDARVRGYETTVAEPGRGRLCRVRLAVRARGRGVGIPRPA